MTQTGVIHIDKQCTLIKTFKGIHVMNNFLSVVLFNTNKHIYTIGDMITLISAMILLCGIVFVSLVVGIKQ